MSSEIHIPYTIGNVIYAVIANPAGSYWNGATFESFNSAHWSSYAVSVPNFDTIGEYVADFPAAITAEGLYTVTCYAQASTSPAASDPTAGVLLVTWPGSGQGITQPLLQGPYIAGSAAVALASAMLNMTAFLAATSANQLAALTQASDDIDRGLRYQGRKYLIDQWREFPRTAYDSSKRTLLGIGPVGPLGPAGVGVADVIWDWNYETNMAVVPAPVCQACIIQANWVLTPGYAERIDAQHQGVTAQRTGPLGESYGPSEALCSGLARRAYLLMTRYEIKQGRML